MNKSAKNKLEDLIKALDNSIRYDHGNMKFYYYAGTKELAKAVTDARILLSEEKIHILEELPNAI